MAVYYATPSGNGNNSGDSWANAFSSSDLQTSYSGATGDTFYLSGGTYNYTSDLTNTADANSAVINQLIGVKSTTTNEPPINSDMATGTDRPVISFTGNYKIETGNYTRILNLIVETSSSYYAVILDSYCQIANCKVTQNNSSGVLVGNYSTIFNCELIGNSSGIGAILGAETVCIGNYIDNFGEAVRVNSGGLFVVNNILANATTGIYSFIYSSSTLMNNIIYECTTGMSNLAGTYSNILFSNVITGCSVGFYYTNSGVATVNFVDYNDWYSNTIDTSSNAGSSEDSSIKGPNDIDAEPKFNDPGSGDFSLQSSSSLINAGFPLTLGVG